MGSRSTALGFRPLTTRQAVLVAVVAFLLLVPYTSPGGVFTQHATWLRLRVDEGTVLYDSLRVARGQVPYRDFFEFPGPVFFFLYGRLFGLVGPSIEAARWLNITMLATSASLIAIVGSRLAGRAAGIAVAVVHTCALVPSYPFAYTHWVAELAALGAIALLATERPTRLGDGLGGALAALSLLTIVSMGLPLLVGALGTVWLTGAVRRDARMALGRTALVAAGAFAILGGAVSYFASRHAFAQFLYCTWTWPLERYALGQGEGMEYGSALDNAVRAHQSLGEPLREAAVQTLNIVVDAPKCVVPAAAIASLGALVALWRRRRAGVSRVVAAGMCLAAASPAILGKTRGDVTHLAFVGGFGLLAACVVLGTLRRLRRVRLVATAVFALPAIVCAGSYLGKSHAVWHASPYKTFREEFTKGEMGGANVLRKMRDDLDLRLRPRDAIVMGYLSGYYHLLIRPSVSPMTRLSTTSTAEMYTEEQLAQIAHTVARRKPKVIASWKSYHFDLIARREPEVRKHYRRYDSGIWVLDAWARQEGLVVDEAPSRKRRKAPEPAPESAPESP